jgi:hypothetical protein
MLSFFRWWYGAGWVLAWQRLGERLQSIARVFSVKLLVRTLFSPWRRVVSAPGRGFDAAIHAAIDNAVGRFIGFMVRCIVLLAAGVSLAALAIFGSVLLILWPFLPPLAALCIVWGAVR